MAQISKADMEMIYSSGVFSESKPSSLQKKVFFEVMLNLCRRGRENLRNPEKDSFAVKVKVSPVYKGQKVQEGGEISVDDKTIIGRGNIGYRIYSVSLSYYPTRLRLVG